MVQQSVFWGIKPVLFKMYGFSVCTYPVFVFLGILAGAFVYFLEARKQNDIGEYSFLIVVGALVGGTIGAKFFELLINIDKLHTGSFILMIVNGKTIVGGLIGGLVGTAVVKKILKIKTRKGNYFAPAVALGLSIGRIGCFFNGCCYGKPSHLPWAVNFGDGIGRHPTQLYESVFMFCVFIFLWNIRNNYKSKPGYLFTLFLIIYLVFRFFIEFIREERVAFYKFTYFQLLTFIMLIYIIGKELYFRNKAKVGTVISTNK
jgi:phosphatidylglycerol---prolipoprotein diacylglyceryl transferase